MVTPGNNVKPVAPPGTIDVSSAASYGWERWSLQTRPRLTFGNEIAKFQAVQLFSEKL
jgi:hypothetical protein